MGGKYFEELAVGDVFKHEPARTITETEVVAKRESRSRPQWGIVTFEHRASNQRGEIIMRCGRAAMMQRRPS